MILPGEQQHLLSTENKGQVIVNVNDSNARVGVTPGQKRFGYSLCALAAIAQSFRATLLQMIITEAPIPQSISYLSMAVVFSVLSIAGLLFFKVNPLPVFKQRSTILVWCSRAVAASAMQYLCFVSLEYVAVGTALTIFATAPSMGSLFAFLFLRDPITFADIGILVANIIGAIFVISPGSHIQEVAIATTTGGVIAAFANAVVEASATNLEKALSTRKMHVLMILLAIAAGSVFSFLALIKWEDFNVFIIYPLKSSGMFLVAFLTFVTYALLVYSMRYCRPGLVLVVRNLAVPISFFLGYIFLGQTPSLLQLFGTFLVLSSILVTGLN